MSTTTKGTHTPGPWVPVTGQGAHHRDVYIRHGEKQPDGTWPAVAKCTSTGIGARVVVEANARLIAASPELLDVCKAIALAIVATAESAERDGRLVHWDRLQPLIDRADAIIAKAEGGA